MSNTPIEERATFWAIVAIIIIAAFCSVAVAETTSTQFAVSAVVPRKVEITYRHEPETITVTEGAIKYGKLEVLGSYYRVRSNAGAYILTFLPLTGTPITMTINDKTKVPMTVIPAEVTVIPKQREDVVYVSYSITVPADTVPGVYPFPVEVIVQ